MDMTEILKTYCAGCVGKYPKLKFVRPEGDRYVHMAGSINPKREPLAVDIICTASQSFFTQEIEELTFESYMQQVGKEPGIKLPREWFDTMSIAGKKLLQEMRDDGQSATAISLPSGPQRS